MKELGRAQHWQGPSIRPQRPAQKAPGTFLSSWGSKTPRSRGQVPQGCWLIARDRAPRGLQLLSTLPAAPCAALRCQTSRPLSDYRPSRSENRRGQILFAQHLTSAELSGLGRRAEEGKGRAQGGFAGPRSAPAPSWGCPRGGELAESTALPASQRCSHGKGRKKINKGDRGKGVTSLTQS